VSTRRYKIVQALGKYNKHIDAKDRVEIDEWFREVYRKAWINPTQNKKA
jgi:DNA-binding transcriptional regulator/RsmH inhibitor MraZ